MTREEQLHFCKVCVHQKPDMRQGLLCGLTGQLADFENSCEQFTESPSLLEKMEKKRIESVIDEKMAGRGLRFANFLLDSIALLLFSFTAGLVLGVFLSFFWFDGLVMLEESGRGVNYLISILFGIIYYTLFETLTGRTPAKYITGTRVVCSDGSKPEFNTVIIRSISRFIPLEPISFLGIQATGWHDRLSNTVVVKQDALPVFSKPQGYYPGVGQSFALTGLVLLLMVAHAPVYLIFLPLGEDFSSFVYYTAFVVIAFLIIRKWRKKHTRKELFHFSWKNLRFLPLVAIAAIAVQVGIISPLVSLVPVPENLQSIMVYEVYGVTFFGILTIVLVAPVMEEFIFRGIMQDGLTSHIGPVKAILLTSILFGFIHLNPWQFITGFVLGIFMGWLYYLTRDIILAIAFHLVNNLFVVLIYAYVGLDDPEREISTVLDAMPTKISNPLIITVSLVIALGLTVYFGFAMKKSQTTPTPVTGIPEEVE